MKIDSLKKNYFFQISYQILILVIPLIVSPYLTRVLQSENLGTYTYVNSIAYYFVVFANLGISKHAQRVIANARENEEELRKSFWGLYTIHSLFSVASIVAFSLFSLLAKEDTNIYLIHILYVASALFDVTWLFQGLENFKSVVINNAIVKTVECIFIFVFVKGTNDLWIYTLIMCLSIMIGQLVMLPKAIMIAKPIGIGKKDIVIHIKPMLILFVAVVASTLYTVLDKTLLGLMSTKDDVAYYEYSNKIITIPKQLVIVIGTVMFPRACRAYNDQKIVLLKNYIDVSMLATSFLSFAFTFGIMAVGSKFAIVYYGEEFAKTGDALIYMAPLIFVVMFGDILRSEYLIPAKKDFLYTLCMVISAVLNIILSIILIPFLGIYGAIIGTTVAEVFGLAFQIFCCRKIYPFKMFFFKAIPFLLIGSVMFVVVMLIDRCTPTTVWYLLLEITIGAIIYVGLTVILLFTALKKYRANLKENFLKSKKVVEE